MMSQMALDLAETQNTPFFIFIFYLPFFSFVFVFGFFFVLVFFLCVEFAFFHSSVSGC